jgi:hypothetical protein
MKSITICQPYAELILLGEKRVENRVWSTPYRGSLLIHAGKSRTWLDTYEPLPAHMDFGGIVGVCLLAACFPAKAIRGKKVPHEYQDLANHVHVEGPYCWVLEQVARFPDVINYRGEQGMFEIQKATVLGAVEALVADGTISREMANQYLA